MPDLWRLVAGDWSWILAFRTLELCVFTVLFSLVLGIPVAWLLARGPRRGRGFWAAIATLPLGVPPILSAAPFFSLGNVAASTVVCAFALSLCFFPVVALLVGAQLEGVPEGEEEAARALSGAFGAWRGVLGRRLWPSILASAGAVGALSLWEMGAPDLLGTPTLSAEVYRQLNAAAGVDASAAGARAALAALPVPFLALVLLWPAMRLLRGASGDLNRASHRINIVGALALLVSPGALVWRFGREIDAPNEVWNTLAGTSDAIWNTLWSATWSAAFCTFGALGLCLAWREWPRNWRRLIGILVVIPGLFAPVVIGVALIEWFNRDAFAALYDSKMGMVLWGHFARFFPVAIALLWPAVARLNADALHAAQGLGASPFRTAISIALPLLKTPLAATFAVLWAACAGELTVSVLVHGPGGETLTLPIFNFLHAGIASDVAILALVLMLGCGAAMGIAGVLSRAASR